MAGKRRHPSIFAIYRMVEEHCQARAFERVEPREWDILSEDSTDFVLNFRYAGSRRTIMTA
jgi:hypothetical protein